MFHKNEPHWLWSFAWVPIYFMVQYTAGYPEGVEQYFSRSWYPFLSEILRSVLGRFPFSVGDIAYGVLIAYVIQKIYAYSKDHQSIKKILLFVGRTISLVYLVFNLSWGLNYYRQPLSMSLGLQKIEKDSSALKILSRALVQKTNTLHDQLSNNLDQAVAVPYTINDLLNKTPEGFEVLAKKYPFLAYKQTALKKSLIATPLSYTGYAGYLNPFSLEAQVNQKIPLYRLPLVASHEVGHQLGYASERDTNFIGYLAALKHPDPYFKYAATSLALSYCLRDLNREDPLAYRDLLGEIRPGVLKNYQASNDFWKAYENPLSPYFERIFNSFLKMNQQTAGVQSYGQIVQLLLAYHHEYPLQ